MHYQGSVTFTSAHTCLEVHSSRRFLKGPQQVDARGSTFNDVSGDQHNTINIIIDNSRSAYVEVDEKVDKDSYISVNISSKLSLRVSSVHP